MLPFLSLPFTLYFTFSFFSINHSFFPSPFLFLPFFHLFFLPFHLYFFLSLSNHFSLLSPFLSFHLSFIFPPPLLPLLLSLSFSFFLFSPLKHLLSALCAAASGLGAETAVLGVSQPVDDIHWEPETNHRGENLHHGNGVSPPGTAVC